MVKNILVLLSILLFGASSLAANKESYFYLKTIAGANKVSNIKTIDSDINFSLNQASKISPVFGFGIGYYINSFSRIDLTFEHSRFSFEHKGAPFNYSNAYGTTKGTQSIKRKAIGQSIMLNGYVDIIKRPTFKVFGGIGIGITNLKEKMTNKLNNITLTNGINANLADIETVSTNKKKSNFSYALIAGLEKNVCHNVNIELAYRWKYHGKAKHEDVINKYHGHSLAFGTRFDL
jgi:opacity protein-like surface antigen